MLRCLGLVTYGLVLDVEGPVLGLVLDVEGPVLGLVLDVEGPVLGLGLDVEGPVLGLVLDVEVQSLALSLTSRVQSLALSLTSKVQSLALRVEALALRVEALALRVEALALRFRQKCKVWVNSMPDSSGCRRCVYTHLGSVYRSGVLTQVSNIAETWMTTHIVESCFLTKLNGGLSWLYSADKAAVFWLTSYGSRHAYEKKYKKLSCHRETVRCFVSLNILLSRSRSLKVIRNDTVA